jgi:hypothetical protein
VGAQ